MRPAPGAPAVRLVTEERVAQAVARGEKEIVVASGAIVTPLAKDALRAKGVVLVAAATVAVGHKEVVVPGTVAVAACRKGAALLGELKGVLGKAGREVVERGPVGPCGYAEAAEAVAEAVAQGQAATGLVVDRGGAGAAVVANKVKGIRAVACHDVTSARYARAHLDANVLCVGAGVVTEAVAQDILEAWLSTSFEGGEFVERVRVIDEVERRRGR